MVTFTGVLPINIAKLLIRTGRAQVIAEHPQRFEVSKTKLIWIFAKLKIESDHLIEVIIPHWKSTKLTERLLVLLIRKGRKLHKVLPYLSRFKLKHPVTVFGMMIKKCSPDDFSLYIDRFHGLTKQQAKYLLGKGKDQETIANLSSFNKDAQAYIVNQLKVHT